MPFTLENMQEVTEKTFKKLINYIYKSVDVGKCGISINQEMKMYFDMKYKDYRKEFYVCIIDELIRKIVEDKKLIKGETSITIIDGEEKEEDTRRVLVTLGEEYNHMQLITKRVDKYEHELEDLYVNRGLIVTVNPIDNKTAREQMDRNISINLDRKNYNNFLLAKEGEVLFDLTGNKKDVARIRNMNRKIDVYEDGIFNSLKTVVDVDLLSQMYIKSDFYRNSDIFSTYFIELEGFS